MNISLTIITVIVGLSLCVVFMGPVVARHRCFGGRNPLADTALVALFLPLRGVSEQEVLSILKIIGQAYKLNYSILRPGDCFVGQLSKLDSWQLDKGAENLEKVIYDTYSVRIPSNANQFTILDLVNLIGENRS